MRGAPGVVKEGGGPVHPVMADPAQADARAKRLAAALRDNLARRKARDRAEKAGSPPDDD